jgi:hypothetical protein
MIPFSTETPLRVGPKNVGQSAARKRSVEIKAMIVALSRRNMKQAPVRDVERTPESPADQ